MDRTSKLIETMAEGACQISRKEMMAADLPGNIYIKFEVGEDRITFWEHNNEGGWKAASLPITRSIRAKERLRELWTSLRSNGPC